MIYDLMIANHFIGIRGDEEFMRELVVCLKRGLNCWDGQQREAGRVIDEYIKKIEFELEIREYEQA